MKDYGGKKAQVHPFGMLVSDVWTDIHRIRHKKRRDEHPCQLPVHLLERLILMVTDEGDFVFDPFMGTGTTAVAAKKMGRNYVGVDMDKEYVKIAEKNTKECSVVKVNNRYVSLYLNQIRTMRDIDFEDIWKNQNNDLLFSTNNQIRLRKQIKEETVPPLKQEVEFAHTINYLKKMPMIA